MQFLNRILFVFIICLCSNYSFSQDFFVEENDSVPDFYDNHYKLAVVVVADPFHSLYGGSVWIHHSKARFSTYVEGKWSSVPDNVIYASNETGTSRMSISANKQILVLGLGAGSAIYENFLWYADLGLRYSNYDVAHKPFADHKLTNDSPFRLHYGAGLAAVFFNHAHIQLGVDFETLNINAGLGFVF